MILAKVQMQFLSGPKFTDVEPVDLSTLQFSTSVEGRVGIVSLLVCWSVGWSSRELENRSKDFLDIWHKVTSS